MQVANNYSCACGPDSTGQLCDQEVVLGERGGDESNLVIAIVGGAIAAVVVIAIPIVIVILVIVLLLMKQKRGSSDFGKCYLLPSYMHVPLHAHTHVQPYIDSVFGSRRAKPLCTWQCMSPRIKTTCMIL